MAYTITKTDGTTLTTIIDGTTDSASTSLTLIGKNFPGYGVFLNQNFVKLLENFSNTAGPDDPVQGQLWWDSANKLLKVWQGSLWKVISSSMSSSSAPAQAVVGDLWWDTANNQLKVYSGSTWVTVGPAFTATSGTTGAVADVIADDTVGQATHVVVKFFVNNQLIAILSRDSSFSPLNSATAPGFTTIYPGFNLSSSVSGLKYWGVADNAEKLGGVAAASYAQLGSSNIFTAGQAFRTNTGITVGAGNDLSVTATAGAAAITSTVNNNNLDFYVKVNNTNTKVLTLAGTGQVLLTADPTTNLGVSTKQYVDAQITSVVNSISGVGGDLSGISSSLATFLKKDGTNGITGNILPATTNVYSLGSASFKFAGINATSFTGNLIGNVTGNVTGNLTGAVTGNVTGTVTGTTIGTPNAPSIIKTGVDGTGDIGQSNNKFGTVYATTFQGVSAQAKYADLAERFESDTAYEAGTVVELGGTAEITKVTEELSDKVFGVISTRAAYLMNSAAGNDSTHPPVAVSGRVPVNVIGQVKKGDRLVSAGNGLARSGSPGEITPWNVIGRALTNKNTDGLGTVEAIVKLNS